MAKRFGTKLGPLIDEELIKTLLDEAGWLCPQDHACLRQAGTWKSLAHRHILPDGCTQERLKVHMSCPCTTSTKNMDGESDTVVNATPASQVPATRPCPKLSCAIVTWSITPLKQIFRPNVNHPIPMAGHCHQPISDGLSFFKAIGSQKSHCGVVQHRDATIALSCEPRPVAMPRLKPGSRCRS